jgi:hypothetical protein
VIKVVKYYLLDLERTIGFNRPFFWKPNKRGYTGSLKLAGLFSKGMAEKIVADDFNKTTILISQSWIHKILGKETINEGINN